MNAAIMKGMELLPQNRPPAVEECLDLLISKQAAAEANLVSSVEMDYIKLQNLLAAKKWQEADEETRRVMLKVAGREKEGWLNEESFFNFPCEDLRTIDQLWVKYSNGRFGFRVQKRIYQSLGGTVDSDTEVWREFGEKVGWIKNGKWLCYNDLAFSEKAPEAHLPVVYDVDVTEDVWGGPSVYTGYGYSMTTMDIELVNSSLASRLDECSI